MSNKTEQIMADWAAKVQGYPEKVKEIDAVYKFDIDGVGKWVLNCKDKPGVYKSDSEAECTIKLSEDTLVGLNEKKINAQVAYMMGQIEISGNTFLALKLTDLVF